eukprot:g24817.t1
MDSFARQDWDKTPNYGANGVSGYRVNALNHTGIGIGVYAYFVEEGNIVKAGIALKHAATSPGSLAKFAQKRQRSIGLGSIWVDRLQSGLSTESKSDVTSLSPFSDLGRGPLTPLSRQGSARHGADSTRSWRPLKGRQTKESKSKSNPAWGILANIWSLWESLADYNARRRLDVERQLKRILCPIPEPHLHVPAYFQNLSVDFSGKAAIRQRAKPGGSGKTEPVVFVEIDGSHQLELMHLCSQFHALTRPFPHTGESEIAILTRPAFCRMLVELTIADSAGHVMFHVAVEVFDSVAAPYMLKGSPLTSATVLGVPLDDHGDRVNKSGVTPDEFKLHLVDCLLPHAERKLRRRQKHIDSQLAYGKELCCLHSREGSRASSRLRASFAPADENEAKEFEVDDLPSRDQAYRTDHYNIRRSWIWSDGLSAHSEDEDDDGEGQTEEDALYAHTCMVSKGEYLTSMFLEPEIIQLIWMYFDKFAYLFNVYLDTPTNFLLTPAAQDGKKGGKVKPGDPLKVIAVDCSDVDAEAVLVMTARLKKLWVKMGAIKKAEKNFVSSDKAKATAKVASKATWINKSFEEMSDQEKTPGGRTMNCIPHTLCEQN